MRDLFFFFFFFLKNVTNKIKAKVNAFAQCFLAIIKPNLILVTVIFFTFFLLIDVS